jgi:hypothetical protein
MVRGPRDGNWEHQAFSWRRSSIFLGRIVRVVFMRVNCKCAHQVRPPLAGRQLRASFCRINFGWIVRSIVPLSGTGSGDLQAPFGVAALAWRWRKSISVRSTSAKLAPPS